jgi:hypothetical protein
MEQAKMTNPLIQIDDEVREMTDEEYEAYLEAIANAPELPSAD